MSKNNTGKEILKNLINIKNIIIYVISLMISTIGMGQEVSPLSIAITGACLAGGVPAILVVAAGVIALIMCLNKKDTRVFGKNNLVCGEIVNYKDNNEFNY